MAVTPCQVGRDAKALQSWSTVDHVCVRTLTPYTDDPMLHVVLAPTQLPSSRVTDLRTAGFDVAAFGVVPSEVPACPLGDAVGSGDHLLVQPREDDR